MDRYNLEELIEEITVDAYGEDEQLWAFLQAFEDNLTVPCDGFVIGEPVSVIAFDYDGNERRGLRAQCRRPDAAQHVVAACDVVLPRQSNGALYIGAYRTWLGLAICCQDGWFRSPQPAAQSHLRRSRSPRSD